VHAASSLVHLLGNAVGGGEIMIPNARERAPLVHSITLVACSISVRGSSMPSARTVRRLPKPAWIHSITSSFEPRNTSSVFCNLRLGST
jgi:hypothetical protein